MPESKRQPDPEYAVYVFGRPLMLVLWGLALWGTMIGVRLAWIAVDEGGGAAARFLFAPFVAVPVILAMVMWLGLFLAIRRFRGRDEDRADTADEPDR